MFCKKCGSQIDEDSVFCSKCGANQTIVSSITDEKINDENSQNIYSDTNSEKSTTFVKSEPNNEKHETKGNKKKLKMILIPSVAILIAVTFAIVGYATSFFGLFPALHAKAPVGITLKSLYSMKNLSSAEFDLSVNNDGLEGSASGYFVLGKDLKNSVLDIQVDSGAARAVVNQGNYGVSSLVNDEYEYEYTGGIDEYVVILFPDKAYLPEGYDNPLLSEDYEKLLKYGESQISNAENADEKRNYQYQLDTWKSNAVVINDLVKGKELNTTRIQKIIKEIFEGQTNYALNISDKAAKEAEELISDFVFIECEQESVYSKFIYDFNKSKIGSLNRYTFSFDASNFTVVFLEYFRNRLIDFPELEKALDNYIKSVNSDCFFNTKGFIDYTVGEIRNNLEEAPKINDIYVSMQIDKKNFFHSFEMSWFDINYGMKLSISLQIKNHNKVKPDLDSINSFLDEAKKYEQASDADPNVPANPTDPGVAAINIDDYAGRWHIDGQNYDSDYHAYERNLSIINYGEDHLCFQLFYFRSGAINSLMTLNGNKADFTYENGQYTVSGTLTFNENSITVDIQSSNFEYMPIETMTFDSRDVYDDGFCPRCGREIIYGNLCDCTWCDRCKAWMGGHGHEEGE